MGWRGDEQGESSMIKITVSANPEVMKTLLGIFTAGSFLLTAGCSELKEIAEEYKAEQAAEESKQNRIRTLDIDQPIAKLSVEEISEEFKSNSVVAENKYMNQPVELSGYIGSIDDSLISEKSVGITITGDEYSLSSVSCLKPRSAPEVSELRKGMHVAVRAVITSEKMGIKLSRCKFWSFSQERWIGANQATQTQGTSFNSSRQQQERTLASNSLEKQRRNPAPQTKIEGTEIQKGACTFNDNTMACTVMRTKNQMIMIWSDGVTETYSDQGDGIFVDVRGGRWTDKARGANLLLEHKNGNTISFVHSAS